MISSEVSRFERSMPPPQPAGVAVRQVGTLSTSIKAHQNSARGKAYHQTGLERYLPRSDAESGTDWVSWSRVGMVEATTL